VRPWPPMTTIRDMVSSSTEQTKRNRPGIAPGPVSLV
jgi:hypothetical protein